MTDLVMTTLSFLLTYAIHSTIMLGGALLVVTISKSTGSRWQESFWKLILLGSIATTLFHVWIPWAPSLVRWNTSEIRFYLETEDSLTATALEIATPDGDSVGTFTPTPLSGIEGGKNTFYHAILILFLAWLGWALYRTGQLLAKECRAHRKLVAFSESPPFGVRELAVYLSKQLGHTRRFRLFYSPLVKAPLAYGYRRIYLPPDFESEGQLEQRAQLAHEICHLKSHDPVWSLLTSLLIAVFFFQPLNRLGRRKLLEQMEYRCDEAAVEQAGNRVQYAHSLWRLAERGRNPSRDLLQHGASFVHDSGALTRRVRRVLDVKQQEAKPHISNLVKILAWSSLVLSFPLLPAVSLNQTGSLGLNDRLFPSPGARLFQSTIWTERFQREENPDLQLQIIEAASASHNPALVPWLITLSENHASGEVRQQAVESLLEFEPGLVIPELDRLSSVADHPEVRRQAVETLARFSTPEARALLNRIAISHSEKWLRDEAVDWQRMMELHSRRTNP